MMQFLKNIYHKIIAFTAVCYYGFPTKKIKVIGITGTDGKTTTCCLIHYLLTTANIKSSLVSSVYAQIAGKIYNTGFHVTTPNSWMLQKFLHQAVCNNDKYFILEVTSHSIDQYRIWGIDFDVVALTNITHEHLDYHKKFKNYLLTKYKLLKKAKIAVLNKDDASYKELKKLKFNQTITYAIKEKADITLLNNKFSTKLPGIYNLYNCLAAICVAKIIGIEDKYIKKGLADFNGVKGRYEKVETNSNFEIVVDFAHTPNGLNNVLKTIRPLVKGKLIHIFGAAGKRDFSKRPIMGQISAKYADTIILTEEDSRTENVNLIIDQITEGIKSKKKKIYKIANRQEAINFAVKIAQKNDFLLFTGKAHEKSICRGTTEYPWDEYMAIQKALKGI